MDENKPKFLNPVYGVVKVEDQLTIGLTPRTAMIIPGNAICNIKDLASLRDGDSASRLIIQRQNSDLYECLGQNGFLISPNVRQKMDKDRRIAAWSIEGYDASIKQDLLKQQKVIIRGVGGVGSCLAMNLAKAGLGELVVVDDDIIEEVNLDKSFLFKREHLGLLKREIIRDELQSTTQCVVKTLSVNEFISKSSNSSIAFSALIWCGDTDVKINTLRLLKICIEHGALFATGGVLESTVLVGPILLPDDFDDKLFNRIPVDSEKIKVDNLDQMIKNFNDSRINPGTIHSVSLAAAFLSSALVQALCRAPVVPLHRRILEFDLLTFQFRNCSYDKIW